MFAGEAHARSEALWKAVDSLLADATLPGSLAHKLGPLEANRLRRLGERVSPPLLIAERDASLCISNSIRLLQYVRESCDGPLVVIKGPEVARLYPGGARRFGDIDILVNDAESVHRALISHGLVEFHDPLLTPDFHHLQTLGPTTAG